MTRIELEVNINQKSADIKRLIGDMLRWKILFKYRYPIAFKNIDPSLDFGVH